MNLQSLLVCSEERTCRLLRNVLDELEIDVEHCDDPARATQKLAQQKYEAVIVDCKDERSFSLLKDVRSRRQNRRSVAVAIVDRRTELRSAFERGAHFVVYKPISSEKAKSSFRAARALMRRERRRSERVQVHIPVSLRFQNGHAEQVFVSGLSEGGLSTRLSHSHRDSGVLNLSFTLPDTSIVIEASGVIAWRKENRQAGIQFVNLSDSARRSLKEWVSRKSGDQDDPPIACQVTDISRGGCFLQTDSPFPTQTRVDLLLSAGDCCVRTEGKVRVMQPGFGMGVEFTADPQELQPQIDDLLQRLVVSPNLVPAVLVEPEGLDWEEEVEASAAPAVKEPEDPLLRLFHRAALLPKDEFLAELERERRTPSLAYAPVHKPAERPLHQRLEPRIEVTLPAQIWGRDRNQQSFQQNTSMVNVSHRGARIVGGGLHVKPGDIVHLLFGNNDARFRVIWVGEAGTPREGQVGLQALTTDGQISEP